MNCGDTIYVKDPYGAHAVRFIAQCHGRFMVIVPFGHNNGFLLPDWRAVLRELVALAVPAKLITNTMMVESTAGGTYTGFPLTYPLSAKGLADALGADAAEVRAELADLAVDVDHG